MYIAIDGPAGAGKSTVAQRVANRLSIPYIDTGAMYRSVTWNALRMGISIHDEIHLAQLAESLDIHFIPGAQGQTVYLGGEDVTQAIRSSEVGALVSTVAMHRLVREKLVERQRKMASEATGVVMDGRDIGTHVLKDADVKIYLTASLETRAKRRYDELVREGYKGTYADVLETVAKRDENDEQRTASPLRKAQDAVLLDTTTLSVDEVVEMIVALCEYRQLRKRS
ncbi:(d)CMP kinase [Sulfoacidibacillus thermotolerans]|uniref:Cytidylate kinase n=1 Tax=Sulfoacidibacillus thermotolerans TaxID=1765684 RepID=A0A2U3DCS1_SULT2|nr:(d)CMP kinase [Sulfoacidibacillus thermotolerans]PWI59062.1 cytidylate kinase [Sulfoacidibacillus thermotolerans]